jgi:cytochrome c553
VLRGAGHYEGGCRPCHGRPGEPLPRIPASMTPHAPRLAPRLPSWRPRGLFYIVRHGVKLTGMPAWPAGHRDDEVWAVVAFLRVLPELDAAEYETLIHGEAPEPVPFAASHRQEPAPPALVETTCGRCHGARGHGRGDGAFPRLAGQRATYLYAALRAYARGERPSGIMGPVAAALSGAEMRELARWYSRQSPARVSPPGALEPAGAAASRARGAELARRGLPERDIPACLDCHGPERRRNPHYPLLDGQYARYLEEQLALFGRGHRGGSAWAHLMAEVAPRLTAEQRRDVALYFASRGGDAPTLSREPPAR